MLFDSNPLHDVPDGVPGTGAALKCLDPVAVFVLQVVSKVSPRLAMAVADEDRRFGLLLGFVFLGRREARVLGVLLEDIEHGCDRRAVRGGNGLCRHLQAGRLMFIDFEPVAVAAAFAVNVEVHLFFTHRSRRFRVVGQELFKVIVKPRFVRQLHMKILACDVGCSRGAIGQFSQAPQRLPV